MNIKEASDIFWRIYTAYPEYEDELREVEAYFFLIVKSSEKDYCLFCGDELDFIPTKDGGFCSTRCEDSWNES